MPIGYQSGSGLVGGLGYLADRLRCLEGQLQDVPPSYTIAGGFLVADAAIGDTHIDINTIPYWGESSRIFVVIDAGSEECEIRKATSIVDTTVNFTEPLVYAHAIRDPVLFSSNLIAFPAWFEGIGRQLIGVDVDDTLAFQRALDALIAAGNGILFLPPKTYTLTATITADGGGTKGITIIGAGAEGSVLKFTQTDNTKCLYMKDLTSAKVYDLKIMGVSNINGTDSGIYFEDCSIIRTSGADIVAHNNYGIVVSSASGEATINDCLFSDILTVYSVSMIASSIHFDRNSITSRGIYVSDSNNIIISGNHLVAAYDYGIFIESSGRVSIYGNYINEYTRSIYLLTNADIAIAGNVLIGGETGIYGNNNQTMSYTGNSFNTFSSYAVRAGLTTNLIIGDNAYDSTTKPFTGGNNVSVKRNDAYSEWISAEVFAQAVATCTQTTYGATNDSPRAWIIPNAGGKLGIWWRIPSNFIGGTFNVKVNLYWTTSIGGGYVDIQANYAVITRAADVRAASTTSNIVWIAPLIANSLMITKILDFSTAVYGADALRINIGRNNSADDTNSGNMIILGAEIVFE